MVRDIHRSLEAVGELLEFVDRFVEDHGLDGEVAFATRLVTEELFANLVRHNEGGTDRIEVALAIDKGVLRLTLRDFDVPPCDVPFVGDTGAGQPLGERTAGGLGLHFVRSFFDELSYGHSEGIMSVTATKRVGGRDV
jgi:serine/threonine-protein kinase RsbW